ncbi:MAG: alpha/beta hydrolase [Gemmataceae bacterium]
MSRFASVWVVPILSTFLVPAQTFAENRYEVIEVKDQSYYTGEGADAEKNKLDLYLPKGKKNFPLVVFIHGGGYQKGDRKDGQSLGKTLAARGVGTAVISYRLYPQVKHPGHIQDVARAFAWVKANADKHGGNSSDLFVSGHSAGAHLASLLATDDSYLKAEKLSLKDIRGVVAISGGYRILPIRKDVFGDAEMIKNASPFTHIKGGHPPFLIIYGDGDSPERHALSKEFRDSLKKAGGVAEVLEVKHRNHQELFTKMGDGDPTTEAALKFILKPSTR